MLTTMGHYTHLFRLAFVISFRRAGPSNGFSNSNAQSNSSDTLLLGCEKHRKIIEDGKVRTSCMPRSYRTLPVAFRRALIKRAYVTHLHSNWVH